MNAQVIWPGVMTRLMAARRPAARRGDSGLRDFARKHGLERDVRITAQAMTTDTPIDLRREAHDASWSATTWRTRPRNKVYEQAGVGPEDIEVVELHDCFAHNELLTYEALGPLPAKATPRSSSTTATTPMAARS